MLTDVLLPPDGALLPGVASVMLILMVTPLGPESTLTVPAGVVGRGVAGCPGDGPGDWACTVAVTGSAMRTAEASHINTPGLTAGERFE